MTAGDHLASGLPGGVGLPLFRGSCLRPASAAHRPPPRGLASRSARPRGAWPGRRGRGRRRGRGLPSSGAASDDRCPLVGSGGGLEGLFPADLLSLHPVEGLSPEFRLRLGVGGRLVLTLAATGQGGGAGGVVARARQGLARERDGAEGLVIEGGRGDVELVVIAQLREGQPFGLVGRSILPPEQGREARPDGDLSLGLGQPSFDLRRTPWDCPGPTSRAFRSWSRASSSLPSSSEEKAEVAVGVLVFPDRAGSPLENNRPLRRARSKRRYATPMSIDQSRILGRHASPFGTRLRPSPVRRSAGGREPSCDATGTESGREANGLPGMEECGLRAIQLDEAYERVCAGKGGSRDQGHRGEGVGKGVGVSLGTDRSM